MTRFSLVVPTLRRADTLVHTLATLRTQAEADVEIVVQNNGNDPETRMLIEGLGDSRIQHFSSDEILPMTENWERALSNATGDLLTFVGDDDGLLPDACRVAASALEPSNDELLSWQPFLYLWPKYWNKHRRNRVEAVVSSDFTVRRVPAGSLLERFYAFEAHYSKLPMVYNSFVKRSLIERVRERHGKYFFGSLPDLASGIVNAAFSPAFLKSNRALSIAGLSHHSTGQRLAHSDGRFSQAEMARDFPMIGTGIDNVRSSRNLELVLAGEMTLLQEVVRERQHVVFNPRGLVRAMASAINDSPSRYDETVALISELMSHFELDPTDIAIPPRLDRPPAPDIGVHALGPHEVLLVLDGFEIGLGSVADAVHVMSRRVPDADAMVRPEGAVLQDGIPTVSSTPLSLARDSDGEQVLISGWSEPESWGTWSVDHEALLRFRVGGTNAPGLGVGIRYRLIPAPDGQARVVECAVGGRFVNRWELSRKNVRGELQIDVPADLTGDGTVELRLVNREIWSPLELGIGEDTRRLGIGVEEIRLLERR